MAATYERITSTILGSATNTVTFSSISGAYTDLVMICTLKSSGTTYISLTCNGDTGTNYSRVGMSGNGSSATTELRSNRNQFEPDMGGAGITNNNNYVGILQFFNYSNSTTNKTILARTNNVATGADAVVGTYRSTSPITSITITTSNAETWSVGSIFTIYGIKAGS